MRDSKVLKKYFYLIPFFIQSCVSPIDYYGNRIDLDEENIYLSDLRDRKNDKFVLVFKGDSNRVSKSDLLKRRLTLYRYIELIKNLYGYTESQILEEEAFGVISPRYYVTIQFK